MICIIFEVWPFEEHKDAYLEAAAILRKELEKIDGFISVERFESISEPGKMLSLSTFANEEAVIEWRNTPQHRKIQELGRKKIFRDYRLRVVSTIRDYGMQDREEAPEDSVTLHG